MIENLFLTKSVEPVKPIVKNVILTKGGFVRFFYFDVRYSTLLRLPPLSFHCVGGCWDSNPGLLRLWH
jgi:hypothetical protein